MRAHPSTKRNNDEKEDVTRCFRKGGMKNTATVRSKIHPPKSSAGLKQCEISGISSLRVLPILLLLLRTEPTTAAAAFCLSPCTATAFNRRTGSPANRCVAPIQSRRTTLFSTTTDSKTSTTSSENDDGDREDKNDGTYFFSPNVPLDSSRESSSSSPPSPGTRDEPDAGGEYSFFDEAVIYVRAGSGGQGSSTYKKAAGGQNGPPDGGNGGGGGSVVLIVDPSLNTLAGLTHAWRPNSFGGSGASYHSGGGGSQQQYQRTRPKSFRAENGGDGGRQFKNGRNGKDVYIRVPPGTVVQEKIDPSSPNRGSDYGWDAKEDDEEDDDDGDRLIDLGSLTDEDDRLVVALGGDGGEGTGVQGRNRGVRRPRVSAAGGERKLLKLTLKIVADVALVGVPNAGKSTLLASVTRAKPKIANYPFTTLVPNLGVWIPPEVAAASGGVGEGSGRDGSPTSFTRGSGSEGLVLCDVPGLIAGAADGVGLGHAFLRHVERCHVILHLVDATSNDPAADYQMLNEEIVRYGTSGKLAGMPQVVVVNKIDAYENGDDDENYLDDGDDENEDIANASAVEDWERGLRVRRSREELEEQLRAVMPHTRLMWMSAKNRNGVDDLMKRLAAFVKKVKESSS